MSHHMVIPRVDSLFAEHCRQPMMLGIFATNGTGSGGINTLPSSYEMSWDHSLAIARMAEDIGFELFMPVSRWRGFGGQSNFAGDTFETLTYMAAIAAVTSRLMTITTIHLPMVHPVFAAKALATIDHVSHGRGGINMVMGWYKEEMGMFGLAPHQPEDRYAYAREWLDIVQRLWTEQESFDYKGQFFDLKNLVSNPKPLQLHPPIVSAATSPDGIEFAAHHADLTFARSDDPERLRAHCQKMRATAAGAGNADVGVASLLLVVCRETEAEARDYHRNLRDHADLVATRQMAISSGMNIDAIPEEKRKEALRDIAMSAGSDALIGTPKQVAEKIIEFHDLGVNAIFLGFHDYLNELPFFAERVLPILEKRGVRLPKS